MSAGSFTRNLHVLEKGPKARFSSPHLARFLQPDSIVPGPANPQNLNRYAYTLNNPLRYTDPSGHVVCDEFGQCFEGSKIVSGQMKTGEMGKGAFQPNYQSPTSEQSLEDELKTQVCGGNLPQLDICIEKPASQTSPSISNCSTNPNLLICVQPSNSEPCNIDNQQCNAQVAAGIWSVIETHGAQLAKEFEGFPTWFTSIGKGLGLFASLASCESDWHPAQCLVQVGMDTTGDIFIVAPLTQAGIVTGCGLGAYATVQSGGWGCLPGGLAGGGVGYAAGTIWVSDFTNNVQAWYGPWLDESSQVSRYCQKTNICQSR